MHTKALPGFRDFYPEDCALRTHIFAAWRRVALRFGFDEYDGPPLEPLDLYTSKSGPEIVTQLYAFEDKGGRQVALRPEMTPTLARMVAARANGLRKPIRWFTMPQLFRYERQQRGRLREHFQFNCDLIGEPGPLADAEVIALAVEVMRELGLGPQDVRVRLSDRRVLAALLRRAGVVEEMLPEAYQVVDKIERLTPEALEEMLERSGLGAGMAEPLRVIAGLRGMPAVDEALASIPGGEDAGTGLRAVVAGLEALGVGDFVDVDLTIVRGLAYYTGTVFELFDAGRSLRAICGGGRYDGLLLALGGVDLPACGFGMGDVVLGELLKDRTLVPEAPGRLDVWVAGVTPEDQTHVLSLTGELRRAGVRTEYGLSAQALGRQLRHADARGSAWAVVIGPDDRARGEVVLKNLATKVQQNVPRDRAVATLRTALAASITSHETPMAHDG